MFIGGSRSNSAPTRNTHSYGLERGHAPKPSVTLKVKVIGIEEYQEKLKQLVELVEEINSVEINIETSGRFEL